MVIRYETWEDGSIAILREDKDGNRFYELLTGPDGQIKW